jgi:uroporphyrinogen-III synthase
MFEPRMDRLDIIHYPNCRIEAIAMSAEISAALADVPNSDWIVFTSKNSARIFDEHLKSAHLKIGKSSRVAAVGSKTAEFLSYLGYRDIFVPEREDAAGLVAELPAVVGPGNAKILLPQGEKAPDLLFEGLLAAGHQVRRVDIYRTLPTPPEELPDIDPVQVDFFVFTNPLSVTYYHDRGYTLPENAWVAAIGRPTAETISGLFRPPDYFPLKADLAEIARVIREQT